MNVTFCGHSDVSQRGNVRQWLYEAVEGLITQETADTFLLGGYGGFDRMASFVVWELKKKYPHVKSILVLPYLSAYGLDTFFGNRLGNRAGILGGVILILIGVRIFIMG